MILQAFKSPDPEFEINRLPFEKLVIKKHKAFFNARVAYNFVRMVDRNYWNFTL